MIPITLSDLDNAKNAVKKLFGDDGKIISDVIRRFPYNTDPTEVAIKISVINLVDSVQLARSKSKLSLCNLVDIILSISDFDRRIEEGYPSLVEEIAKQSKKNHNINVFSFASKYCHYHNSCVHDKDDYSIYDSIVGCNLYRFDDEIKKTYPDKWRSECDYRSYNDAIGRILEKNNIAHPKKRALFDNFVWYHGRSSAPFNF